MPRRRSGRGRGGSIRRPLSLARGALALLIGIAVAIGGAGAPASAYDEGTIVSLVNGARAANALNGLVSNPSLDAVALGWAQQLAASGTLSHNPSVGDQIPGGWTSWGENVAQGYASGPAVHDGWMNSPGHRANILGDFTDIGVALIDGGGTTWAVEVFATYPGSGGAPPPPVAAAPAPAPAPAPEPAPAAEAPVETAPAVPAPAATASSAPTATAAALTVSPTASSSPSASGTAAGDAAAAVDPRGDAGAGSEGSWWLWAVGIGAAVLLAVLLAVPVVRRRLLGERGARIRSR